MSEIKNAILKICCDEIISYLTEEDEDTGKSLDNSTANEFIQSHIDYINSVVEKIIEEYDYDEDNDILNKESDYIREYLYEDQSLLEEMDNFKANELNQ